MKCKTLIVGCILVAVSFSGCQKGDTNVKDDKQTNNYEESDKSTDIDLSKFDITSEEDNHSGLMFMPTKLKDSSQLRFKKFNGIYTMGKFKLEKGQNLNIDYSCKVESGKLTLFVLDPSNKVMKTLSTNTKETFELKAEVEGEYIIKAVADEGYEGEVVIDF
jgi:hypothetical protein